MNVVTSHTLMTWRDQAIAHTTKAIAAAEKFDKLKPNIVAHIKDNPHLYGADDFSLRKALDANYTLGDLARSHAFHRDQANMLWTAIASEASFREMMGK